MANGFNLFGKRQTDFNKPIKSVKYMGVTNQVVDTKLGMFLNEYIQDNVYSFYVTYKDGTAETIHVPSSDSQKVNYYMSYVNRETAKQAAVSSRAETINQLDQLTRLHDKHVISDEIYERESKKLVSLLNQDAGEADLDDGKSECNFHVQIQSHARGVGKVFLFVDGHRMPPELVNGNYDFYIPDGSHKIYFSNGASYSRRTSITIDADTQYKVLLKIGLIAINADVQKVQ